MSIQIQQATPNLPAVIFRHADLAAHYRAVRLRLSGPVAPPRYAPRPIINAERGRSIEAPALAPPAKPDFPHHVEVHGRSLEACTLLLPPDAEWDAMWSRPLSETNPNFKELEEEGND